MADEIRMKRIAAFFLKELSRIVSRELKDPVLEGKLISFPDVNISRDLSKAHVKVSILGNGADLAEVVRVLNSAEKFIRHEIMAVSDFRRIPVFVFHKDTSIETAVRVEGILDMLDIPSDELPTDGES